MALALSKCTWYPLVLAAYVLAKAAPLARLIWIVEAGPMNGV